MAYHKRMFIFMSVLSFEVGGLYGDKNGVEMFFYIGRYFDLYVFYESAYDDDKCNYVPIPRKMYLTAREVKSFVRW
jgi:hypothetical protein